MRNFIGLIFFTSPLVNPSDPPKVKIDSLPADVTVGCADPEIET